MLSEQESRLSGGEKQRISIARALLADKKILVLDEATAALDPETEYQLQKNLGKFIAGKTAIIIAHRLSTIKDVDRIVVINKGRAVQIGTHATLLKKKGLYRTLWNIQKRGYSRQR